MSAASAPSIRVLLADDHAVVRKGLRALIELEPGIAVAGEASTGEEAVEQYRRLRPDVVVMDLEMPGIGGTEAARRIVEADPAARVVVLTSHAAEVDVLPALRAGAQGYLLKHSPPEDVVRAIRQAVAGETVLHPSVARLVLQDLRRPARPATAPSVESLSDREVDVLRLVARGLSNQAIADALVIGEATVRSHVSAILGKLRLANRTQAALFALREGIVTLGDADLPD